METDLDPLNMAPRTPPGAYAVQPLRFHSARGRSIDIFDNATSAQRNAEFSAGEAEAFSARPVRVNEKIYLRIIGTKNSCTPNVRFGFTWQDPASLTNSALLKGKIWLTTMNVCQKEVRMYYYINSISDVNFCINADYNSITDSKVDTAVPLWAMVVIDSHDCIVQFAEPKQNQVSVFNRNEADADDETIAHTGVLSTIDPLPRYQTPLDPLKLHRTKGKNVYLGPQITSKQKGTFCHGYVFSSQPLPPGRTIVIQIHSVEPGRLGSLVYGFTYSNPKTLKPRDLPNDALQLLVQPEDWVVRSHVVTGLCRGDELAVTLTPDGHVKESHNNTDPATVLHVDVTRKLWAFVDLYEATHKVKILITRKLRDPNAVVPLNIRMRTKNEIIFLDNQATKVRIDCGRQGYVFTAHPIRPLHTITIQVSSCRTGGHWKPSVTLGFTSHDPATLKPSDLSENPLDLADRIEYLYSPCSLLLRKKEEIAFTVSLNGEIGESRSTRNRKPVTVMRVDLTRRLWAFIKFGRELEWVTLLITQTVQSLPQEQLVCGSENATSGDFTTCISATSSDVGVTTVATGRNVGATGSDVFASTSVMYRDVGATTSATGRNVDASGSDIVASTSAMYRHISATSSSAGRDACQTSNAWRRIDSETSSTVLNSSEEMSAAKRRKVVEADRATDTEIAVTTETNSAPRTPPGAYAVQPLRFHSAHGKSIDIFNNATSAQRNAEGSEGGGEAFSARPIRVNEMIYLRIVGTKNSCTPNVRFGFTWQDPANLTNSTLSKGKIWLTTMNVCQKEVRMYYYINSASDVHIYINGDDNSITDSKVDTAVPFWAMVVIDSHDCIVQIAEPKQNQVSVFNRNEADADDETIAHTGVLSTIDPLPRYQTPLYPLKLHRTKGKNVNLGLPITSKKKGTFCHGYVFSSQPLPPGRTIVIQIHSVELKYRGSLVYGFTYSNPKTLKPRQLPDDAMQLLAQPEDWVVRSPAITRLRRGDELAVTLSPDGHVKESTNNSEPATVLHVDVTRKLWAFVDLYEATHKVRILISRKLQVRDPNAVVPLNLHASREKEVNILEDQVTMVKIDSACEGYLFTARPIRPLHTITIQVFSIPTRRLWSPSVSVGFTSRDPATLRPSDLPENSAELADRPEYWYRPSPIFLGKRDELAFTVSLDGEVRENRSTRNKNPVTVMRVDLTRRLWAFIKLGWDIEKVTLLITQTVQSLPQEQIVCGSENATSVDFTTCISASSIDVGVTKSATGRNVGATGSDVVASTSAMYRDVGATTSAMYSEGGATTNATGRNVGATISAAGRDISATSSSAVRDVSETSNACRRIDSETSSTVLNSSEEMSAAKRRKVVEADRATDTEIAVTTETNSAPREDRAEGTRTDPLRFHRVHGNRLGVTGDGSVAQRIEGDFFEGEAYSSRPLRINEKVCFCVRDISNSWEAAVHLGFTTRDPATLPPSDSTDSGKHWVLSLKKEFCSENAIMYYYVNSGYVYFGVNAEDKALLCRVDESPLWALFNIDGLYTTVHLMDTWRSDHEITHQNVFTREIIDEIKYFSNTETPISQLRYQDAPQGYQCLSLHTTTGRNVQHSSGVVAKIDKKICQAYVFTAFPIALGETIVIQILTKPSWSASSLIYGLTSCDPATLNQRDLPNNAYRLLNRPEHWVLHKHDKLDKGDELALVLTPNGEVEERINRCNVEKTIRVQNRAKLWAFFDFNGSITKVRIMTSRTYPAQLQTSRVQAEPASQSIVQVKSTQHDLEQPSTSQPQERSSQPEHTDEADACITCLTEPKNCAILKCGHMCMCYTCASQVWKSKEVHRRVCPICRTKITDVIRIYKS